MFSSLGQFVVLFGTLYVVTAETAADPADPQTSTTTWLPPACGSDLPVYGGPTAPSCIEKGYGYKFDFPVGDVDEATPPRNSLYYKFFRKLPKTIMSAAAMCRSQGARLPLIRSLEQDEWLHSSWRDDGDNKGGFWLGNKKCNQDVYTNWATDEPNGGGPDIFVMPYFPGANGSYTGKWNDTNGMFDINNRKWVACECEEPPQITTNILDMAADQTSNPLHVKDFFSESARSVLSFSHAVFAVVLVLF
jgi:hypothetical protein